MNIREIFQETIHTLGSHLKGLLMATGPFILAATAITFLTLKVLDNWFSYAVVFSSFFITVVLNAYITLAGLKYFFSRESSDITITKSKIFSYSYATIYISIASTLGYLFFIIPGIFILCISFFYPIFILKDNQGPIQAIESSIELVKGNFKQTLLLYTGLALLTSAVNYIASYIFSFLSIPFQIDLILIDLLSHCIYLVSIPLMLVMHKSFTACNNVALIVQALPTAEPSDETN